MAPDQLFPLEFNPQTKEPFLRLRKHKNIIITPLRLEDGPHFVSVLNDPRVYDWLMRTPFPYSLKDGEEWIQYKKPKLDAFLQELKDAQGAEALKLANGTPIEYLREVKEDGTDVFIGNISIARCLHGELMNTETIDWERAKENMADNEKLEIGDPNIIWSIGDYLAPSHHGQGIMTDAIDTLLHDWAIPRMGVRRMLTCAFVGNYGSVKVFEKNGFVTVRTVDEHSEVRGKKRGMHVIKWSYEQGSIDF